MDVSTASLDEVEPEREPAYFEYEGREFRVTDEGVALAPMIIVAQLAQQGVDANEMRGLAALGDLLMTCLYDDDEYARFMAYATEKRADGDDLMGVVKKIMGVMGDRPTRRSSDASDGPQSTDTNSTGDSTSRVVTRFVSQGRPDLALLVFDGVNEREAREAAAS